MKIKTTTTTTEIECSAEELRQSNSLADSFTGILRRCFNGPSTYEDYTEEDGDACEES